MKTLETIKRKLQKRKEETPEVVLLLNKILAILIILLIILCFVKSEHIPKENNQNLPIATTVASE